jgi:hypothetical protein
MGKYYRIVYCENCGILLNGETLEWQEPIDWESGFQGDERHFEHRHISCPLCKSIVFDD